MNKTIIIVGGFVVVAIIAGVVVYNAQNKSLIYTVNSTSTTSVPSKADTSTVLVPSQVQQAGVPVVTTDANAAPADTTVVVVGKVVPNGAFTNYWYEYGTTSSLGSRISGQDVGSGFISISAPGYITGLSKDTTYYFRLVAQNKFGTVAGAVYSFQTTHNVPPPVGSVPTTKTLAASGVLRTGATLNGEITPNQATTQYWFEYGNTTSLGSAIGFVSIGAGTAKIPVSISLSNLDPATTYYFRLNAQNQFGTMISSVLNFKTAGPASATAPSVTTGSVTSVSTSTVVLRGIVNPEGADTTYWFEYSTDSHFKSALNTTDQQSAGAGSNNVSVTTNASNLAFRTSYYFRIVAQNSVGAVRGNTATFKTR